MKTSNQYQRERIVWTDWIPINWLQMAIGLKICLNAIRIFRAYFFLFSICQQKHVTSFVHENRAIARTIKFLFARLSIWTFVGVTIASWSSFNSIIWLISFWLICCNIKSFFCGFVQLCVEFHLLVNLFYSVGSDTRLRAKGQNSVAFA